MKPISGKRTSLILLLLCGLLLLAAAWIYLKRQGGASNATSANAGYVDAKVCEPCHADVVATYRRTGMGRSFYRPTMANVIEDYTRANRLFHRPSGLQYTMLARDGKFFERRSSIAADGTETNVREEQIDYVLGSGNHARTYLHRTPQGKLVELPVSWYVENSGSWNMSPGFDRVDHLDMNGTIGRECMFCHNAYMLTGDDDPGAAIDVFQENLPEGIDCQRCHGPGAAHVAAANAKAARDKIRSTIVEPSKLPRERQLEVCMQCHLETNALHQPNSIKAYGRELESFMPGQSLGDYRVYFENPMAAGEENSGNAHAGYQLFRSKCFRSSEMTCLTCHDPHDVRHGAEARQQYIETCRKCHAAVEHKGVAMTAGNDCISCHMPRRRSEGSVHVVLTDHSIYRIRPPGDLTAPFPEKRFKEDHAKVDIFYPRSAQPANAVLYRAVARVNDDGVDGIGELQGMLDRGRPQWPAPYVALGKAYARAGKMDDALRSFDEALRVSSNDRAVLYEKGSLLLASGRLAKAAEVLEHASQQYPKDDRFLVDLGSAYLHGGKLAEAQNALSRAIAVNPNQAEANDLLGLCAVERGDRQQAETMFREAIRLKANMPSPENNLANLLVSERRYAEAEVSFRRALELNPKYADAQHGYGLLLILTNRQREAVDRLRAAAAADPGNGQIHTDLADLLSAQGALADAAAEYRLALERSSHLPDANLGLGMILLQQGQRDEAVRYLMVAAQGADSEVSQHARSVLAQMGR